MPKFTEIEFHCQYRAEDLAPDSVEVLDALEDNGFPRDPSLVKMIEGGERVERFLFEVTLTVAGLPALVEQGPGVWVRP